MSAGYTRAEISNLPPDAMPERGEYCPQCRIFIPKFADVSPETEADLRALPAISAMKELLGRTGCRLTWAHIWYLHPKGPHAEEPQERDVPPCPQCGAPLRTELAQQCFECGADWHDSLTAT